MPIPQLHSKRRFNQSWRNGKKKKKKYYIERNKQVKKNIGYKPKHRDTEGIFSRKNIALVFIILFVSGVVLTFGAVAWLSRGLPDPNHLIDRRLAQTTKIYDRTGETVLYEIHGNEQRTLAALDEIPDYVKQATIAIEDKDFYNHGGISLWGIFRGVVWRKLRGLPAQGGSTLTQQFVKNAILTSERTIKRKFKEWLLAYKIEQRFDKDEILQMYLNEIPYGSTAYGVEAASRRFFDKSVRDINLPEAAILAALPQAPSRYSPYGSNKELLIGRQHYILDLMMEQGYITEAKVVAAKQFELEFRPPKENIIAPHFVMYVKEMLSEKYGQKTVEQGGLKIYTTLDLYKQEIAEETIVEHAENNETEHDATNAALVSIDPKTGQILAMVGSRDYFNDDIDGQVNIATSKRQPGSSLKPLVYATAFTRGYTPDTVLYDVVTDFSNDKTEPYEPHNYDLKERGPVTIRTALAGSLNIPAVKAIYLAGINNVLDLAEDFGYTTLSDRDRFGLSLVLGGGEVTLLEHTNAYGAFAREGIVHPTTAILKVEDNNGNILEEFEEQEKKVLDPKVTRQINDILSDNEARAYAFGERNWLTLGTRPVAAKTGTTNDYRDAWTIGYTPSIVTGVWVGNNDNSEMKRGAAGGVVAAPVWHDYMKKILGDTPIEQFRDPEPVKTGKPVLDGKISGEVKVRIDKSTGLLATEYTPTEYITEELFREDHCILYYINKNDPRGESPENPEADPQFELWESRVKEWAETEGYATSSPPTEKDNLHRPENRPQLRVVKPINNQTVMEPLFVSEIRTTAPRGINRAEYYINGILLSSIGQYPFNLTEQIDFLDNGFHTLTVRVCDDVDNCSEEKINFNLVLDTERPAGDLSVSWKSPKNGLALTNVDFPLPLEIAVSHPKQVAKVDIYFYGENSNPVFLTSVQPVNSSPVSAAWNTVPVSGTYKLYAEAVSWSDETKRTNELILAVTNIATSSPE